jgi:hypothetical protein
MLTGLEAEIIGQELQIKANNLSMSQMDSLVEFCHRNHLDYNLESSYIFKIYEP